jgi:hypothetical protein
MKAVKILALALALIATTFFVSTVQAEVPSEGLVAYFPFEDSPSDVSAGHEGIVEGAITYPEGKVGNAAHFDGSSFISVDGEDFALTEWTVSFWIYLEDKPSNRYTPVCKKAGVDGSGVSNYVTYYDQHGYLQQFYQSCDDSRMKRAGLSPSPVDTWTGDVGNWFQWTMTMDAEGTFTLYINGIRHLWGNGEDRSWGTEEPCADPETPFLIGGKATYLDNNFKGLIDELRVYSVALSQDEVKDLSGTEKVWVLEETGTTNDLLAVRGSNPTDVFAVEQDVFAVGQVDTILHHKGNANYLPKFLRFEHRQQPPVHFPSNVPQLSSLFSPLFMLICQINIF